MEETGFEIIRGAQRTLTVKEQMMMMMMMITLTNVPQEEDPRSLNTVFSKTDQPTTLSDTRCA